MKCKLIALFLVVAMLLPLFAACAEEPQPTATPQPAAAYILVTVGEEYRWFPLPSSVENEYTFTVRQTNPETGEEYTNVIAVTVEGVYMKESTCDNQDCVDEGIVTIENKETRILGNMIVCLPHNIMIELYTWQEILASMSTGGSDEAAE